MAGASASRDVANVTMDMDDTEILRLNGLSGSNTLTVGDLSGTDLALVVYTGGTGPDTINAALAFTDIQATGGDDNDNFTTGAGADVLDGGAGNDTIIAGAGNDIIVGGAGADALAGGAGDDIFRFFAGAELVGGEVLAGQNGIHDAVQLINTGNIEFTAVTFGGIETVQFLAGNSSASFNAAQLGDIANVVGGAGVDRFIVNGSSMDLGGLAFSSWNAAVDQIILVGTAGNDNLAGTNLADVFVSGLGANVLNGRFGNDLYYLNDGSATIIDAGGLDTIVSTITRSLAALPAIERLVLGGTAAINGTGNNAANTLVGNAAANILTGGLGADILSGGNGNDRLIGGVGIDTLTGGLNNDIFVFNAPLSALNRDIITDFNHVADTFQLENGVMAALGAGVHALSATMFRAGAAAADASDHVIYNQANGQLFYDSNGNGAGGVTLLAVLTNKPVLAANDFVVI